MDTASAFQSASVFKTPLYEQHQQLGAKLIPFGGYLLPVWYSSAKSEHLAVRRDAGVFDISHMGIFWIFGADAPAFLETVTCASTRKAAKGKMTYGMVLNSDGGILDDIMVGKSGNMWILIANASNKARIGEWFAENRFGDVRIEADGGRCGFVAVQGPSAIPKAAKAFNADLDQIGRFEVAPLSILGINCFVMRTGYTGEDGIELIVPTEHTVTVWQALISAGITPCGLAARDSLRIEAGLPLYGQELNETVTPLQTRYPWVVNWAGPFIGKPALLEMKETGVPTTTIGLVVENRMIPRPHCAILEGGEITSGSLVPDAENAIAMAIVPTELAEVGTVLTVQIRDRKVRGTVVPLPFVK
ncbi:glycine cleavage system aminomethyltransferase GcvT [bacterium]|nr:glycine cleavage system aminomethyltransferase GcvT [bacterium]